MDQMETRRLELDKRLKEIKIDHFTYFQPPANINMNYPAIRYERNAIPVRHADNNVYCLNYSYTVTVIDKDTRGDLASEVSRLPKMRFVRHYKSGNLNHDVFEIFC